MTESKQMVKKEKGAAKYIVNSNGISIREEADASSKRLAIANFGDIFTISDSNKNEKKMLNGYKLHYQMVKLDG